MISVSHLTALDASPEDFIDAAAEAGFDGVGLRIAPPRHTPTQWPVVGDAGRIRDLRRRADDLDLRIFEAESFMMNADTDRDDLRRALDAAAELGAECLVSAGGDPVEQRLIAGHAALAEAAARYGILVGIEFMAFRPLRSLADAVRVCKAVGHGNARLLIDALHLQRSGGRPDDVARLDASVVGYIHLCDAAIATPPGMTLADEARTGRLLPGEGVLPLHALLDAVPEGTPVSLEAPVGALGHLPPRERLRLAGERTHAFLAERRAGVPRARAD